jgi:hypothetical protein
LTLLYFEIHPFTKGAIVKGSWPSRSESPPGEPLGLTMGWVNFPYVMEDTLSARPVALQVHSGDWHAASGIYRSWFHQHFTIERPRSWLRQQNARRSIILSNGEDVIVVAAIPKSLFVEYILSLNQILTKPPACRRLPRSKPNATLGSPVRKGPARRVYGGQ